jgi:hypothetical protein
MTALKRYQRLEASGLWRASAEAQRVDVIVSIGDATLVITDMQERALAHWSLAAVARANPGRAPALYHPDGDPGETLELPENEGEMIAAIETLRSAIDKRRPHPGRLRFAVMAAVAVAVIGAAAIWLPPALRAHAVSVVPEVKRTEIGDALFRQIRRVAGPPCDAPGGQDALRKLAARIPGPEGGGRLAVMRDGVRKSVHLPGGTILLGRSLVEDHAEPDVVAGYLIAERLRAEATDPLARLLSARPVWATIRLLTTGELRTATLRAYAETLLTRERPPVEEQLLLTGFAAWGVRSTPYAYAQDISGETTLGLIEADPYASVAPEPVLTDADWLRLQAICGG